MKKRYLLTPLPLQIILRTSLRPLYKIFLETEVVGLENLKKVDGNFIVASNHVHELDAAHIPVLVPVRHFPKPLFFVSLSKDHYLKKGLRAKLFYGGFFFKMIGGYEAYKGVNDFEKSLSNHINILNNGASVCIFPEGRVIEDDSIVPAKGGVAFLSKYTGLPVVPTKLSLERLDHKKRFSLKQFRLKLIVGEAIASQELFEDREYSYEDYKQAAESILDRIRNLN